MGSTVARPQQSVLERDDAEGVPANDETVVLAYTVPRATMWLDELVMGGTFPALFRIYIDGVPKEDKRLEMPNMDVRATFPPLRLKGNAEVEVRVTHYDDGEEHDYWASLKAHR